MFFIFWFFVVVGWLVILCVVGYMVMVVSNIVKMEMIDVEFMKKLFFFFLVEMWSWIGIFLVLFVVVLFYLMVLGMSVWMFFLFFFVLIVLGYIVGFK